MEEARELRSRFSVKVFNMAKIQQIDSRRALPEKGRVAATGKFDIVFADFGYNSLQLENASQWGLSYMEEGPLDMRYSPSYRSCADILGNISQYELAQILKMYGELTNAEIIAKEIIKRR